MAVNPDPTIKLNTNLGIEPDGTVIATGEATTWNDLSIFPDATGKGGTAPIWTLFQGPLYLWNFTNGATKEVFFCVQLPHSYKEGSDLLPHVHWTTFDAIANNTNKVEWVLDYSIAKIGSIISPQTTLMGNQIIPSITTFAAQQQYITSLGTIPGTGLEISVILVCRLSRNATGTSTTDTFADDAGLLSIDFHYEMDTNGSRNVFAK